MTPLQSLARQVADALARGDKQLVLAESCTAGLVAASLGGVPGVSRHFCGSAVVYQERSKAAWLDVPEDLFRSPGVVSAEVAAAMTAGALRRTPYADLAVSVTGHLGPGAPSELDGVIYVATERRGGSAVVTRHELPFPGAEPDEIRLQRQSAAAAVVLQRALESLGTAY